MSKIKVNSIEAATGTTITIPSGQTLDISATTLTLPSTVVTTTGTQTLTNKTIGVSQLTGTLGVANGGTGLTSLGTASQVLRVNSGATALEFATADTGKILGVKQFTNSTRQSGVTQTANRTVLWQVGSFTKVKANTKLKINLVLPGGGAASTYPHFATDFIRFSTTGYDVDGSDIFGYIHNTRTDALTFGANLIGNFLYDTASTNISGTGTVYITLGYKSNSGGSIHPFDVWNPNSSEDARSRQTTSYVVITELDF